MPSHSLPPWSSITPDCRSNNDTESRHKFRDSSRDHRIHDILFGNVCVVIVCLCFRSFFCFVLNECTRGHLGNCHLTFGESNTSPSPTGGNATQVRVGGTFNDTPPVPLILLLSRALEGIHTGPGVQLLSGGRCCCVLCRAAGQRVPTRALNKV